MKKILFHNDNLQYYVTSDYRQFKQGEKHIDRIFDQFVMIFMLDNKLLFTEGEEDIKLEK